MRKAYVLVAYFGGLRCIEIHNIDLEDVEESPNQGYFITINRTKQGGKSSQSKFLIPFAGNYAQILKEYLQALGQDVKETSGPLFRAATRHTIGDGKLSITPLGLNTMGAIGIEVATLLGLKDPQSYTGYR